MEQRKSEWLEKADLDYHQRQYKEPYRSTVAFCDWLEKLGYISLTSALNIVDFGSGQGANIYYMKQRYPQCKFTGIDINRTLVEKGNDYFAENDLLECSLHVGDIYNLEEKYCRAFDGLVSYQTLSWLPDYKEPLEAMIKLEPEWIALSSLFYDGPVSCTIEIAGYYDNNSLYKKEFYNIYSLKLVKEYLAERGYGNFQYVPFEMDIDLEKPDHGGMGTYTRKLEDGRRIQLSGPLLMPWYFIAVNRV